MATLETGAGSSTLAFAAGGAEHVAITPDGGEEARIRAKARALGIDDSKVSFRIGPSHELLPALEERPLDLCLVDGAHGFPYPILDWWYLARACASAAACSSTTPTCRRFDSRRRPAAAAGLGARRDVGYRTVVRAQAGGAPARLGLGR